MDPARWICSRSQLSRSAFPKAGVDPAAIGTSDPPGFLCLGVWACPRGAVHLVLRQLLVEALTAHSEDFGRRGSISPTEIKRGVDIVPFHQADGVLHQCAK